MNAETLKNRLALLVLSPIPFLLVACGSASLSPIPGTSGPDASSETGSPEAAGEDVSSDTAETSPPLEAASESAAQEAEASVPTKATFTPQQTLDLATTTTGHLAFPDLTRLKDGQILLVYREGASHVDASGRIMKQFGTADGLTWTSPEVLYDEPSIDDRDPSVTTLANGDVMVNYFQYKSLKLADGTMAVHHIFASRSTDNGKTFGTFVQVNPGSMSPSNPKLNAQGRWVDDTDKELLVWGSSSSVVELGGKLVLPAYGGYPLNLKALANCPKSTINLYTSTDGLSWTEVPVPFGATTTWLQEPAMLRLANGTTLMHLRTAQGSSPSNAGKMKQSISTDDTATWADLTDFPFVGHAPELAQLSSGLVLTGYRQLNSSYTHEWVSFSWSLDNGQTWSEPVQVEDCNTSECGYPAILELDSKRFLFAYYAPGGDAIRGVIYEYTLE